MLIKSAYSLRMRLVSLFMCIGFLFVGGDLYSMRSCLSYSIMANVERLTSNVYMDQYNRYPNNTISLLTDTAGYNGQLASMDQTFFEVPDGIYYFSVEDHETCLVTIETNRYMVAQDDEFIFRYYCKERPTMEMDVVKNDYIHALNARNKYYLTSDMVELKLISQDTRLSINEDNKLVFVPDGAESITETFQYCLIYHELRDTASVTVAVRYEDCIEEDPEEEVIILTPADLFTPNGDGIADTWSIGNLSLYNRFLIRIYDRRGVLLKEYQNEYEPWDGMSNGKAMSSDDYWYYIYLYDADQAYTGHFSLIR